MQDIHGMLDRLRRPRLLIQAAREGSEGYRRAAHLARLFGPGPLPCSGEALIRLMEIEAGHDADRRSGAQGYSLVAHVDVLIAIMGEVQHARERGLHMHA